MERVSPSSMGRFKRNRQTAQIDRPRKPLLGKNLVPRCFCPKAQPDQIETGEMHAPRRRESYEVLGRGPELLGPGRR
jgi:hypothetical protein